MSAHAAAARRHPRHTGILARLLEVLAVHHSRRRLADMDAHTLRDIGITRDQALAEADRRAWDVAPTWRR